MHGFKGAGMFNYANLLMEMFIKYGKELCGDMRTMYEAMWLMNTAAGWIGVDLGVERNIGTAKVSPLLGFECRG